jgi:DNA-binding Lrp family transcriptional regulator
LRSAAHERYDLFVVRADLDSVDKRILDLLVEDARRSASEIGRLVSLYIFAPITPAVRTRTCSTR